MGTTTNELSNGNAFSDKAKLTITLVFCFVIESTIMFAIFKEHVGWAAIYGFVCAMRGQFLYRRGKC